MNFSDYKYNSNNNHVESSLSLLKLLKAIQFCMITILMILFFSDFNRNGTQYITTHQLIDGFASLLLFLSIYFRKKDHYSLSIYFMFYSMLSILWLPFIFFPEDLIHRIILFSFSPYLVFLNTTFFSLKRAISFIIIQLFVGAYIFNSLPELSSSNCLSLLLYFLSFNFIFILYNANKGDSSNDQNSHEFRIINMELIDREKKLYNEIFFDKLTSLGSSFKFDKDIEELLKLKDPFCIIDIDLDSFGIVNETQGPQFGNQLLIQFAECVNNIVNSDYIYRRSEDEFFVMLKTDSHSIINSVLNDITYSLEVNSRNDNFIISCTYSAGVSIYPEDGNIAAELLQQSNLALDRAKRNGKNNHVFYTPELYSRMEKHYKIKKTIDESLKSDAFDLYFQPIYNLNDHKIHAAEILLRPQCKDFSLYEILNVAELTFQIIAIDYWVLKKAFEIISSNIDAFKNITISINLSAQTFKSDHLVDYLIQLQEKFLVSTTQLELEITEHSIINNIENSIYRINLLKKLGFRIAIDDFGTKYSSLNYISKLQFDTLKIDKSFIDNITSKHSDLVIVKHLILISRELKLKSVAEGIENIEQGELLKELNCDLGQGFLFAEPMPSNDFLEALFENHERI